MSNINAIQSVPSIDVFKNNILDNKVWIISGGGSGIGKGIATNAARLGAKIVIGGRREQKLQETCKEINDICKKENSNGLVTYCQLDVRDEQKCKDIAKFTYDKFGRIDVLVNNAAGNFSSAIEDTSLNGFRTVMEIDLFGCFNMSKAVLDYFKKNSANGSLIINITASLHYKAAPFQFHASAAKAGIDVLTNVAGIEFAENNIRCVSIAPGPIDNTVGGPTGRVFGGGKGGKAQLDRDAIMNVCPVGRFGHVDDIANACVFCASPAGSFITATSILVDGGHW